MFQSTRPAMGATSNTSVPLLLALFSIHAPREGRDTNHWDSYNRSNQFQSTRPARGATGSTTNRLASLLFQSTRPARGATFGGWGCAVAFVFQSTRPARGATRSHGEHVQEHYRFNPRAPRGARRKD